MKWFEVFMQNGGEHFKRNVYAGNENEAMLQAEKCFEGTCYGSREVTEIAMDQCLGMCTMYKMIEKNQ